MNKILLIILLQVIFWGTSFAQVIPGSIAGKITDGGDQKIIDAATVSLYKAADSSLVKVNLTDKAGNFEFQNIPEGKYYVIASSIGHSSSFSGTVNLKPGGHVSVGALKLENEIKTLKGITVAAKGRSLNGK